jgi:hypothetical protein
LDEIVGPPPNPPAGGANHQAGAQPPEPQRAPLWAYALETVYLVLLVVAFLAYVKDADFRGWLPDPLGPLPVVVPWSGAIGTVVVAIFGLYMHRADWDDSYDYWYGVRPLTGAVLGSFGYVFLAVIIQSTGNPAVGSKTGSGDLVYAALAFIIGFSQKTFHDLLERATAVIFGPGDGNPARPPSQRNQGAGDQQGPGGGAASGGG